VVFLAASLLWTSVAPDLTRVIEEFPSATAHRYALRDDTGATMDCLKVAQGAKPGYFGVYHTLSEGAFTLKLARSSDLLNWRWVVNLDRRAHQGTLRIEGQRVFLAYEKDQPGKPNWIRVREYASLDQLIANEWSREFDIPTTLSKFAEGTPHIESVRTAPDGKTVVDLGFHYYRDGKVDRQASGTLTDFAQWRARPSDALNDAIEKLGVKGNIGDRDAVALGLQRAWVVEGMKVPDDWATWGLYFLDRVTQDVRPLKFQTHGGSKAAANPSVTVCVSPRGKQCVVVSLFIPSQGAAEGEAGQLLFYREIEF